MDELGFGTISIHALREEGDLMTKIEKCTVSNFYPRPPRGGRRLGLPRSLTTPIFLSTPSARRATRHCPRPRLVKIISIHALREEGD